MCKSVKVGNMVQNVGPSKIQASFSIDKVGTLDNGRVLYQVTDTNGKVTGKVSVPAKNSDVFEKSYNDIISNTPKVEEYYKNTPKEKIERRKKIGKWILGASVGVGAGIPLFIPGSSTLKQLALTIGGSLIGFGLGSYLSSKTSPPGTLELAKATQKISRLDIRPEM